jgi:hypothetical protein
MYVVPYIFAYRPALAELIVLTLYHKKHYLKCAGGRVKLSIFLSDLRGCFHTAKRAKIGALK